MTASTRGRHRKLRRNILHTVVATALLAGTFTVVDQSINPAPANAAAPVVNSSTPPAVSETGRAVVISFNEDISTAFAPVSSYVLNVDGFNIAISSVTRPNPTSISLNLSSSNAVTGEQVVKVTYNAPPVDNVSTTNLAVQDLAGIDAASFSNVTVVNGSTLIRPIFSSVAIGSDGTTLTWQITPAALLEFMVDPVFRVNGEIQNLTSNGGSSGTGSASWSMINPPIASTDVVTMDYTYAYSYPSRTAVKKEIGYVVTNNSTVLADTAPPVLQSAILAADGKTITLTYNESLNISSATVPPVSQFTVKAGGTTYLIKSRARASNVITLVLEAYIDSTKSVTLDYSYTPTGSVSRSNLAIQDPSGNDAAALSNQSVTNQSTQPVDTTGPTISTITSGSTTTVILTYNEPLSSTISPAEAFTVFINGGTGITPTSVSQTAFNRITLTVPNSIPANAVIDVLYTAPTRDDSVSTNPAVQDYLGNDAKSRLTNGYGLWTWENGVTPTVTGECIQGTFPDSNRQRILPNKITYSIGVSGSKSCIGSSNEPLSGRGGVDSQFASIGSVSEPGTFIHTRLGTAAECGIKLANSVQSCIRPDNFVIVKFSEPVSNPVISLAGWGSAAASRSWSEMKLVTPGLTLTMLPGTVSTNLILTENGTYLKPGTITPSTSCPNASGTGAGCGSFRVNGTVTEVKFQLNFFANGSDWGELDAWNMTAGVTEDFGFAPESYDQGNAASHVFGPLRLGANVTPDNLGFLYTTINGDAVASGDPIPSGEDGVTSWPVIGPAGTSYSVNVNLGNVTSTANLCGWVDFNANGIFDSTEKACRSSIASNTLTSQLTWTVPNDVVAGATYSRLRLSFASVASPIGKLTSGEVEDYKLLAVLDTPFATNDISSGSFNVNQTISPLSNDTPDPNAAFDLTTLKLCSLDNPETSSTTEATQVSPNCTLTILKTADGLYSVNPDGTVTFNPDDDFTGTVTQPVSYQISDVATPSETVTATITPTVHGAPSADPETTTGLKGDAQSVNLLVGDTSAAGITLVPESVRLCPATTTTPQITTACTLEILVVAGIGTYRVVAGLMTFTPEPTYAGTPPPVVYQVTDSVGGKASSTYTPTVIPPPVADDETSTGAFNTAQAPIDVLLGDTPGNSAAPLDPSTLKLCDLSTTPPQTGATCDKTSVTTADGTYEIVAGKVVFTPANNFHGVATPIDYIVKDSLGQVAQGTITPTVNKPTPPTADPETKSVLPGQSVSFTTITGANGLASGTQLQTTGVNKTCLFTPNTTICDADNSITIAGEGTYTLDPATGIVTFAADPSATSGSKTPITYRVTDVTGQSATDTLTPIIPPPPVADDETDTVPFNTAKQIDVLNGDTPGDPSAPLMPATLKLCGSNETAPNCTKDEVIVPEGTYEVVNGKVVFTPNTNFSGPVTPIDYIVEDSLGQVADGTITLNVPTPPAPTARPDVTSGPWNQPQSINVVDNASGNTGDDVAGTGATLIPSSVVLSCGAAANCSTATVNGKIEVTIANQGTYSLGSNGEVVFTPLSTFKNTATPVTYTVSDNSGQSATSTYTPTVNPPAPPTADPETTSGPKGATQTIDLLPGDATTAVGITLDPTSVRLCPATTTTPQTTTACNLTSLVVPGIGTYVVVDGVMTFTPLPNYVGTPPPVVYQVTDSVGGKASSTYTPTVIPPPILVPDTSTGPWDTNQTRNVVTNNVNTSDSAAAGTTLAAGSVRLCAPSDTAPNCTVDASGSVVIANQGTYTLDPATGIVTFDPLPTFTGTATPVTYSVTDALGQKSSTTYTPTVTVPPVPTATPDTVELLPGQSKVFSSIFDGQTGDTDPALATKGTGAPDLTNSSVCLLTPGTTTCDADGIVTIPGEGTYTLNATTGIVTYAALSSATPGAKTPVTYQITDGLGRSVTSTLTPTITPPPVANPDFSTGVQGAIQTLSPVGNDRPGGGASTELFPDTRAQVPSGIFLCAANQPPPDCAATTVDVFENNVKLGTLTVAATGLVTFTPEPNFVGTTPAIGYQLPDNLGQKAYSTITITVVPPPAPAATIDTGSAEYNKPVTLRPWINDSAGAVPAGSSAPAPSLIATSIKLCGDNSTFVAMSGTPADCTATKVKTVEGTYEVNATTGEVVFTPNPNMVDPITGLPTGKGFVGTVKYPPTYQIWNNYSGAGGVKSATALLVPTIAPPGAPAATVDITKTKPGTSVVLNPVSNDKPGTAALDPTTIRLCGTGEISPACTQMSVTTLDGLYVVDPTNGQVTFTPRDGFTGQATIPYIIKDGLGMMALSSLIITVEDTAVVPVVKKTKVGLAKTGGTRPDLLLLLGLVAIAAAGGLRVLGRKK